MDNNKPMALAILLGFALGLPLEDAMLRLVNDYRGSRNMDTLYCLEALQKAAEYQAQVMCSTGRLTHEGVDKEHHALDDRLRVFDFVGENIGENIARQENDEYAEVFKLWVKSNEHRKNILGDYTYTGISTCRDKSGYRFWIQVFGKDVSNSFIRTLRYREMGGFSGKCMDAAEKDGTNRSSLSTGMYQEYGGNPGAHKSDESLAGYFSVHEGLGGYRGLDVNGYRGGGGSGLGLGRAGMSVRDCIGKKGGHSQGTGKYADGFMDEGARKNLQDQVARIVVDILQAGIIQGLRFLGLKDGYCGAQRQANGMHLQGDPGSKSSDQPAEMDMQLRQRPSGKDQSGDALGGKDGADEKLGKSSRSKDGGEGTEAGQQGKTKPGAGGSAGASRDPHLSDPNMPVNRGENHMQAGEAQQQNQSDSQTPARQAADPSILGHAGQSASRDARTSSVDGEKQAQNGSQGQNDYGIEKCTLDKNCKRIDIGLPVYLGAQWGEKK